ncbi:hypothetical protein MKX01_009023, partial [Papaver californicum]
MPGLLNLLPQQERPGSLTTQVRLCEKGGGQKWPCCTSLPSSMGSALSFLGEYANMILMRCEALHLTFVGPGACNKSLRLNFCTHL